MRNRGTMKVTRRRKPRWRRKQRRRYDSFCYVHNCVDDDDDDEDDEDKYEDDDDDNDDDNVAC